MNQLTTKKQTALSSFAERFKVDPEQMEHTLRTTVFKQSGEEQVTNEQMVMLMVVADQHSLNPFTKEIYAFPDKKGGIVPVVGVDGWSRLINSNKNFNGMDFKQSETLIKMDDSAKSCPEWMEVIIYRKDRDHPIVVREYLDEVYRPAFKGNGRNGPYEVAGPWQSHTKRMLRHKAMIQGARIAFGFGGIYDEDEADRILETNREAIEVEGVTVETEKPAQSKAEAMAGRIGQKQAKNAAPEDNETPAADVTARGKAVLKGKITKCKSLEELQALNPICAEFVGSEWQDELSKAYSAKRMEFVDGAD